MNPQGTRQHEHLHQQVEPANGHFGQAPSTLGAPEAFSGAKRSAPPTVSDENQEPRRSHRARQSTIVMVNGQPVLTKNNYVLKGDSYEYQPVPEDKPTMKPKPKQPLQSQTVIVQTNKKPRMATKEEVERKNHNATITGRRDSKQVLRNSFLHRDADTLDPFVSSEVLQQLRNIAPEDYSHKEVYMQPEFIQGELRDYQLQGLNFMVRMHRQNLSMILGDEMGLGKTLQTISLLCYLKEHEGVTGPSLVVCPLSVLYSWCSELTRWAPHLKFQRLHSPDPVEQDAQRRQLIDEGQSFDVIVTTYEMVKLKVLKSAFQRLHFNYLVLDEGHKIKGHDTQIAQAVRKLHCENKLILTGTPLQNNLVELWSLLEFLYPTVFTDPQPFEEAFNLKENHVDKVMLLRAQKVLDLFMLRRLKNQVEKLLPPKLETKVYCPLSSTQAFWYKAILLKDLGSLANAAKSDESGEGLAKNHHSVLRSLFMQLRKCCQHPFLFDGAETNPEETNITELVGASGKLAVLDMLLCSLSNKGHRAVLFSQFTTVLDVIEDYCLLRGWKYCRFDGNTERAKRNYLVQRFNAENSPFFLFIMSTKSGGMGLNLQSADTCIIYDSDWNPQNDNQAMARVHRIGQKNTVHVYRLVTAGTVEERIVARAEKKLLLNQTVNRENAAIEDETTGLSSKELLADIKFGCEAIFGESTKNELPSTTDIEQITDRSRTESSNFGKLKGGEMKTAEKFDAEAAFAETQVFGGVDFRKIRQEQEREQRQNLPKNLAGIGYLWQEISKLGKRKGKSRIVFLDGKDSGYGQASVPVLASNNYDLEHGESSVFDRELSHKNKTKFAVPATKKRGKSFANQDFCQVCLDGGSLILCPRCPVSLHLQCCGISKAKDFLCCSHHSCNSCNKPAHRAGGLLFPCQICSQAWCEDCLPTGNDGFRVLGRCERFEELGFNSTKNTVYVHCSTECEKFSKREFGWKLETHKQVSPAPLDLESHFGATNVDLSKVPEDEAESLQRRRAAALKIPRYTADESDSSSGSSGYYDSLQDLEDAAEENLYEKRSGEIVRGPRDLKRQETNGGGVAKASRAPESLSMRPFSSQTLAHTITGQRVQHTSLKPPPKPSGSAAESAFAKSRPQIRKGSITKACSGPQALLKRSSSNVPVHKEPTTQQLQQRQSLKEPETIDLTMDD